jgi:hypothetical protein
MASITINTAVIDAVMSTSSNADKCVDVAYVHDFGLLQHLCNTYPEKVNHALVDAVRFQLTRPEVVHFLLSWPRLTRPKIFLGVAKEYANRACGKPTSSHLTHVNITPEEAREAFKIILSGVCNDNDRLDSIWFMECAMPFIKKDDVEVLQCVIDKFLALGYKVKTLSTFFFGCAISGTSLRCLEVTVNTFGLSEDTQEKKSRICSSEKKCIPLKLKVLRRASAKAFSYLKILPNFKSLNHLDQLSETELFRLASNKAALQIHPTLLEEPCFTADAVKHRAVKLIRCNVDFFGAMLDRFGASVLPEPQDVAKLFVAALEQGALDATKLLIERCGAMCANSWPRSCQNDINKTTMLSQVFRGDMDVEFMTYMTSETMQKYIDVRGQLLEVLEHHCGAGVFDFVCQRLDTLFFGPGARAASSEEQRRLCTAVTDRHHYKGLSFFELGAKVSRAWPKTFQQVNESC